MKKQEFFELFKCCIERLESTEFFKEFNSSFPYSKPTSKFENWQSVANLKNSLKWEFDSKGDLENKEILKLIAKHLNMAREAGYFGCFERLRILEDAFGTFLGYFIDHFFEEKEKITRENN